MKKLNNIFFCIKNTHNNNMADDKHLHINIFKENKDKIESAPNMSEAFIIMANEDLNNKFRDVLDELTAVKGDYDTLMEDNERMEVTITNQRGLLHNFNGLKNHEIKRADLFEKLYKNQRELVKEMIEHENKLNSHQSYSGLLFGVMVIMFFLSGIIDFVAVVCFTISLMSSYFGTSHITGFKKNVIVSTNKTYLDKENRLNDNIRRVDAEIKEITSKNDFISHIIDGT